MFLAVQDSSIGDLVTDSSDSLTDSVTHLLISEHYRAVVDNVIDERLLRDLRETFDRLLRNF